MCSVSIGTGLYLLGAIAFYRLLNLYEQGVIFSAANVVEINGWEGIWRFMASSPSRAVPLAVPFTTAAFHRSRCWISPRRRGSWGGSAIIFVAGIMDEGRKIQEEQALTV